MKTLYLVRHAKSSWDDHLLTDEKRPLNERGTRDAPLIAQKWASVSGNVDLLITSPAKRARSTAKFFRKAKELGKSQLRIDSRLYLASPGQIWEVLREIPKEVEVVALFGHNPGMTDFLNNYSDGRVDNMPTCAVARIDFNITDWNLTKDIRGKMVDFFYPKKLGLN